MPVNHDRCRFSTAPSANSGLEDAELSIERIILYPVEAAIDQKELIAIHQTELHARRVLAQLTVQDHVTGVLMLDS